MFKKIFFPLLLGLTFLQAPEVRACDACGCGVGSYQFGILPQQARNFAGIRYQYKTDHSTPHHDLKTSETFRTTEFWGRFYPTKKIQVFAILPYNFNEQTIEKTTTNVHGLGDALILANYNLINNTDSLYENVKHNLLLGGGVKLATGKYNRQTEGNTLNPNLQLGSGSYDFVANAIYTIRYNQIGLNSDISCKYNTANQDEFRFGNKLVASSRLFSVLKIKESALMPNAGISTERTAKDTHYGSTLKESGGYANFLNLGTEAYFKKLSTGFTFQKPISQHLSEGFVETGNRWMTHLTYMF
ncbi:hypothetical protein [Adhaeribacter soli]|uniref:Transporter n=1 Tax=Adhaeribacter soli TaxID=2607655 RepID=A0A5N1IP56_9BACT|nr:hypothetical protein [Adhaeribacter soli]KAA9325687.1 hypothetical protein F0P94_17285 [Adhaeribacter soli]